MQSTRIDHRFGRLLMPTLLVVLCAIYLFARFLAGDRFLAFFEDDYFYYLAVARQICAGHGSTFDEIHKTNGYHPLWMLINVLLSFCFGGRDFFYALLSIMLGAVLATYLATKSCFAVYIPRRQAACYAFLVSAQFALIMAGGMEIVLAVPLIAWLSSYRINCFRWTVEKGGLYGLISSLVILARLDAILLVVPLALLELSLEARTPVRERLKVAGAYAVGLTPVAFYIAMNIALFDIATPVSGAAKQLRIDHTPSLTAIKIAFLSGWLPVEIIARPVFVAMGLAALILAFRGRARLKGEHRALVCSLMAFPVLQLGLLSVLSDWPIWEWYFYPFIAAAIGAILVLCSRQSAWALAASRYASVFCAIVGLGLLLKLTVHDVRAAGMPSHSMYDFYYAAESIARFGQDHPGRYAMGDRSGLVGYELKRPLIQLEGLMMDKDFLENIRHQRNLFDVLKAYGVRYYIATNPKPASVSGNENCFSFREPAQAGRTSPVMQGTLCSQPVLAFRFNGIRTLIFDLDQMPASGGF